MMYASVEDNSEYICRSVYSYIEDSLLPSFTVGVDKVLPVVKNASNQDVRKLSRSSIELYCMMHYIIKMKRKLRCNK